MKGKNQRSKSLFSLELQMHPIVHPSTGPLYMDTHGRLCVPLLPKRQVNLESCGLYYLRQCICLELWRAVPEGGPDERVGFLGRDTAVGLGPRARQMHKGKEDLRSKARKMRNRVESGIWGGWGKDTRKKKQGCDAHLYILPWLPSHGAEIGPRSILSTPYSPTPYLALEGKAEMCFAFAGQWGAAFLPWNFYRAQGLSRQTWQRLPLTNSMIWGKLFHAFELQFPLL